MEFGPLTEQANSVVFSLSKQWNTHFPVNIFKRITPMQQMRKWILELKLWIKTWISIPTNSEEKEKILRRWNNVSWR